jgi:hypothetical protein
MDLKTAFNNEIKQSSGNRIGEVKLFQCLCNALKSYPNVVSEVCHQKYVKPLNTCLKRELCDILVVVIHRDCLRYSFVQNKYERKKYLGLSKFKIDCGQHMILVQKPFIKFVGDDHYSDILAKSKYNTITAYSVFYKDINGDFDFDFASACSVKCGNENDFKNCCKNKTSAEHCFKRINSNKKNSKVDFDSLLNIDDIERYPHFGEVIFSTDFVNNNKYNVDDQKQKVAALANCINGFNIKDDYLRDKLAKYGLFEGRFSNNDFSNNVPNVVTVDFYIPKLLIVDISKHE